jgi:hypothetical protein
MGMGWNAPQDVLTDSRAAIEELNRRKRIACAALSVDRARKLVESSRELVATGRKLLAQWHSRRASLRARLDRGPLRGRSSSSIPAPTASFKLPKAA